MQHLYKFSLLITCALLPACASTLDKLGAVGKPPSFSDMDAPTRDPNYEPIAWPMPAPKPPEQQYANSLWQPGARAFFRDSRAARVGDILRVNIKFDDKAELTNQTQSKRDGSDSVAAPAVAGIQNKLFGFLPGKADPTNLFDITTATDNKGTGNVKRQEKLTTQVAATVTQILPNGNFVIEGSQEIRVNRELREISVKGVVRPSDISSENTVDSSQIAEARINYGGRGQLTDVQAPRWGSQLIDAVSPF